MEQNKVFLLMPGGVKNEHQTWLAADKICNNYAQAETIYIYAFLLSIYAFLLSIYAFLLSIYAFLLSIGNLTVIGSSILA